MFKQQCVITVAFTYSIYTNDTFPQLVVCAKSCIEVSVMSGSNHFLSLDLPLAGTHFDLSLIKPLHSCENY